MLGAYERGERAISVPRLAAARRDLRGPARPAAARATRRRRDRPHRPATRRLDDGLHDRPRAAARDSTTPTPRCSSRYAATIQLQRQDFNGRMLTIRRDDLRVLAAVLGRSPDELGVRLDELGLRAGADAGDADLARPPLRRRAGDSPLRSRDVTAPSSTQVKILVPGNHLMVDLLGQRDELLRLVEAAFPVDDPRPRQRDHRHAATSADAERVGRLFEEMVAARSSRATRSTARASAARIEMLKADQRPDRGAHHRGAARPQDGAAEDRGPEALRRRRARPHGHVRRSAPPAPARATSRSRSRCRRSRRRQSTASSSPGPRSRRASGSASCPATSSPRSTRTCARSTTRSTTCSTPRPWRRLMDRGTIEVAPLAFMRGRTLNDSFIILDEAQNTTPEQMKMFLTRLGFGSKIVVTGDVTQIDLPEGRGRSGLLAVRDILDGIDGPRVRRARLGATSCGTGSCRTSSTPTNAAANVTATMPRLAVFGADEQDDRRRRPAALGAARRARAARRSGCPTTPRCR